MRSKQKILLVNSYAVNNGDLALVVALYEQLIARGYQVGIATFYYKFLKSQYPNLPFIRELNDYNLGVNATIVKKLFSTLNFFFNKIYNSHDVYIASPGGYVNSYYGLKRSLLPLILAKGRSKKTAIYSQSIGPLNQKDKDRLTNFSKSIDVILVRDDFSQACISSIPCFSKVFQTKDAAFLLTPRVSKVHADCRTVAVSVREWKFDNRDMQNYGDLIQSFCETVLNNGYNIEFISTCQGVEGYRDDSKIASQIRDTLVKKAPQFANQITVNVRYNTYYELIDRLNTQYAFTIGTRLHMCILSLINGTPAFNISYEVKGIECYKYLDMASYSADFNESMNSATEKFNAFLANYKEIQTSLLNRITPIHNEVKKDLEMFLKEMGI